MFVGSSSPSCAPPPLPQTRDWDGTGTGSVWLPGNLPGPHREGPDGLCLRCSRAQDFSQLPGDSGEPCRLGDPWGEGKFWGAEMGPPADRLPALSSWPRASGCVASTRLSDCAHSRGSPSLPTGAPHELKRKRAGASGPFNRNRRAPRVAGVVARGEPHSLRSPQVLQARGPGHAQVRTG